MSRSRQWSSACFIPGVCTHPIFKHSFYCLRLFPAYLILCIISFILSLILYHLCFLRCYPDAPGNWARAHECSALASFKQLVPAFCIEKLPLSVLFTEHLSTVLPDDGARSSRGTGHWKCTDCKRFLTFRALSARE